MATVSLTETRRAFVRRPPIRAPRARAPFGYRLRGSLERFNDKPGDFFIKSTAIAEELWHVAHQDRSAWSFNVEVRPFGEKW